MDGARIFQNLVAAAPKIRTPIQLAGLAFSSFAAFLIYRINPDNVGALAVTGAIAVAILAIPLAFHENVLKWVPKTQRVVFLLVLMAMLLISFGALAYVAVGAVLTLSPAVARFDTKLNLDEVKVVRLNDGRYRMQVGWNFFPLEKASGEGATVFTGLVSIHDEDDIKVAEPSKNPQASCDEVQSCIGARYVKEFWTKPLLVRANTAGTPFVFSVDLKRSPRVARVWWEFYQLEGAAGAQCGVNHAIPGPADGIPPLAMYRGGKKVADSCFRSFGQRLVLVNPL